MNSIPNFQNGAVESCPIVEAPQALADRCGHLGAIEPQSEIQGPPAPHTVGWLIVAYQADPLSNFGKVRYGTRRNYVGLMRRIDDDCGAKTVAEIKHRTVVGLHDLWSSGGKKVAVAHSLVGMLRTLVNYGASLLEDPECERLSGVLRRGRFKMGNARTERITAEQVIAIRTSARAFGYRSIALAQAIQFECILRQKDVIGEWVPENEPGDTDVHKWGQKWHRGVRWEEIDNDLVLHHVTSKRQKVIDIDLTRAPMVMEELRLACGLGPDEALTRADLPSTGPIINAETNGYPFFVHHFRRTWRRIAEHAGVPPAVFNMDSRAGGITEATDAGAELEHVRHAATHGDISMTARYSRGSAEKIAMVQEARMKHRKGLGNDGSGAEGGNEEAARVQARELRPDRARTMRPDDRADQLDRGPREGRPESTSARDEGAARELRVAS